MSAESFEGRLAIDSIAERILKKARPNVAELTALKKPMGDIEQLMRRDYVRALRKRLGYRELLALVSAGNDLWPGLNREKLMWERRQLTEISDQLSVHLSARPRRKPEDMALRGFYVHRSEPMLKQPLIYVNTAHHPVAVAATFCHEVGHHLASARMVESKGRPDRFFFNAAYAKHVDDAVELAADVLVSLAAYPEPIARRIFTRSWSGGVVARAQHLAAETVEDICCHLRESYGVDLTRSGQPRRNLSYLAGMVHFAKLRWALLAEYDL